MTKEETHYRLSANPRKQCGTCAMFRPTTQTCSLVSGDIQATAVCDEWERKQ